jgi:hypothetical protein
MKDPHIRLSAGAVALASDLLDSLGVKHEILGFTTYSG